MLPTSTKLMKKVKKASRNNVGLASDFYGKGTTALLRAACEGCEEVARILIDRGASVNLKDIYGQGAIHKSTLQESCELMRS